MYIDAGVFNNLSWEYFENIASKNKFGIYMYIENKLSILPNDVSFINYFLHILVTVLQKSGDLYENTISLSKENVLILKNENKLIDIISLPPENEIEEMIQYGYNSMKIYLKKTL